MSRRGDGGEYREPLAEGNPRRMTDAKCAWRKMTPEQRTRFLLDIGAERHYDILSKGGVAGYIVPVEATEESKL